MKRHGRPAWASASSWTSPRLHRQGRPAGQPGQPLRKKLVTLVLDDPQDFAWGGEPIVLGGETVGEISSVGWSPLANACVALGYVRGAAAHAVHHGTPAQLMLWGDQVTASVFDQWPIKAK
jgi:glycine cleavage system aminomethyltransferase T